MLLREKSGLTSSAEILLLGKSTESNCITLVKKTSGKTPNCWHTVTVNHIVPWKNWDVRTKEALLANPLRKRGNHVSIMALHYVFQQTQFWRDNWNVLNHDPYCFLYWRKKPIHYRIYNFNTAVSFILPTVKCFHNHLLIWPSCYTALDIMCTWSWFFSRTWLIFTFWTHSNEAPWQT